MGSPELIILDVGHGNCAVLRDTDGVLVIDCAPGSTLLDTLAYLGVNDIATIIISHADHDHVGGLTALLTAKSIQVHSVYLNSDPIKGTESWEDLRYAVKDARERSGTSVRVGLTTELSKKLNAGEVEVEVLAPSPETAMSGVGGRDLSGRRLDANSMSVVLGLIHGSHRAALLPGDLDQVGLDNLAASADDLAADILVFPHHGGNPDTGFGYQFSRQICEGVRPRLVVFSTGRGRFDNPRPEVIAGVIAVCPDTHILCTELCRKCAAEVPGSPPSHLTDLPARAREANGCCGGTIVVKLGGETTQYDPTQELHGAFVKSGSLASPQCMHVPRE